MLVKGVWNPTRVGTFMLKKELLQALAYLFVVEGVVADKRGEQCVKIREGLGAGCLALHGVEEVDDLAECRTEVTGRLAGCISGYAGEAATKEIFKIPAYAVDAEKAEIVDVHRSGCMRLVDLRWIDAVQPVLRADNGGDVLVQPLQRPAGVGTLFHPPVFKIEVLVDKVDIAEYLLCVTESAVLMAVDDVALAASNSPVEKSVFSTRFCTPSTVGWFSPASSCSAPAHLRRVWRPLSCLACRRHEGPGRWRR